MACRALTALLVFSAQRAAADYDAAVAEGILTSLELELKLPWMTVDFDTEVVASGAAMKENYTLVDADILKHALFAGIKAAGDAVRVSLFVMSFEIERDYDNDTTCLAAVGWVNTLNRCLCTTWEPKLEDSSMATTITER